MRWFGSRNWRLDPNVPCGEKGQGSSWLKTWDLNGRGERIRTSDPLVPNQVRYQTALRPEYLLRLDADEWCVP
jgi:hypothetical protein